MILASDLLSMQRTQALVIGDVMLDIYVEGQVTRISPEAPVPILLEKTRRCVLGGAANVAANIADFGAQAFLIGRIGPDEEGARIVELCHNFGIGVSGMVHSPRIKTTRKIRMMAAYQQLVRVDTEDSIPLEHAHREEVLRSVEQFLTSPLSSNCPQKVVIISDYGKGFLGPELIQGIIQLSTVHRTPVVADPKSMDLKRYSGCTLLKPNRSEAREIAKAFGVISSFATWKEEAIGLGQLILKESKASSIAMSLSENGVMGLAFDPQTGEIETQHYGSHVHEVADVSGAGDTMVAFLALGAAAHLPFSKQLVVANAASGISCSKLGTATVVLSELIDSLNDNTQAGDHDVSKILFKEDLTAVVKEIRKKDHTIVFTNGCFDILHAGHVRYLQAAKKKGHTLIVGVNTDASIKKLKGPSRPIQPLEDRLEVLAGLGCVDFVVGFGEDTPINLIREIKPDVLVKGADYIPQNIVGYEDVMSWGGRVEVIPLVEGRSTTRIVQQMKSLNGGV